jgi:hypothetical protein
MPVDCRPKRSSSLVDVQQFLNAYTSNKFVADLNCFHQNPTLKFGAFLWRFSQVKTKLCTGTLLPQVSSHLKTGNSWKQQRKYIHQQ